MYSMLIKCLNCCQESWLSPKQWLIKMATPFNTSQNGESMAVMKVSEPFYATVPCLTAENRTTKQTMVKFTLVMDHPSLQLAGLVRMWDHLSLQLAGLVHMRDCPSLRGHYCMHTVQYNWTNHHRPTPFKTFFFSFSFFGWVGRRGWVGEWCSGQHSPGFFTVWLHKCHMFTIKV